MICWRSYLQIFIPSVPPKLLDTKKARHLNSTNSTSSAFVKYLDSNHEYSSNLFAAKQDESAWLIAKRKCMFFRAAAEEPRIAIFTLHFLDHGTSESRRNLQRILYFHEELQVAIILRTVEIITSIMLNEIDERKPGAAQNYKFRSQCDRFCTVAALSIYFGTAAAHRIRSRATHHFPMVQTYYKAQIPPGPALMVPRNFKLVDPLCVLTRKIIIQTKLPKE